MKSHYEALDGLRGPADGGSSCRGRMATLPRVNWPIVVSGLLWICRRPQT